MRECRRNFDKTKYMTFLTKDDELLKIYTELWDKVSNTMKKGFDNKPVYNGKYLKTKIKFHEGKIDTNFHGDKCQKKIFNAFVYQ